ncbi:MAG TPA: AraC family transcriptional regulator [Dongiaceae bacterium]|jgi:AraC-like DNA-binding protein|nr:AraC family transcriptional regulator [Dongiaceae bacterium]
MAGSGAATPGHAPGGARAFEFSTDAYRKHERIAAWREEFARTVLKLDIVPRSRERFRARATIFRSARYAVLRASTSHVDHDGSSRSMIANDNVSLVWIPSCRARASQLGRSADLEPGDAMLMSHGDAGAVAFSGDCRYLAVALPKSALAPLVRDIGELFARRVPGADPALRVLLRYLDLAQEDHDAADPALQAVLADHVSDLAALALGATRDAAELARTRGLLAARLRAMKDDIRKACCRPDLSIHGIAARHGVSARYVQRIFEESGATFTQYLTEQRLAAAHKALRRAVPAGISISTIAYESGFSDVSHFNRLFRRHFGCTPTEVRNGARPGDGPVET